MNLYLSSTGESAADPIVGYWACLQTNLAGESHYLGGSGEVYAHFKDDGTWTLTVGDETCGNLWITSDQIDGIPYGISFAGDTWGGVITEEDPVDLLAMASLTDPRQRHSLPARGIDHDSYMCDWVAKAAENLLAGSCLERDASCDPPRPLNARCTAHINLLCNRL